MRKKLKFIVLTAIIAACGFGGMAASPSEVLANAEQGEKGELGNEMKNKDRIVLNAQKYKELFGNVKLSDQEMDPNLFNTMNLLLYGEIYYQGNLNDKQREIITLSALAVNQNAELFKNHVGAALQVGVTPVEIKETLYQCAPYIGFPKTLEAVHLANVVLKQKGISLPVESEQRVTEENRFEEGLKVQKGIFGDAIDKMRAGAPANQMHIQNHLSAFCFGDTYTRGGLDLKTRELITFTVIAALGGCESQLKGHVRGNVSVGNDKETLISVITQCIPYIGFPRTLNALGCVNEIIPEK